MYKCLTLTSGHWLWAVGTCWVAVKGKRGKVHAGSAVPRGGHAAAGLVTVSMLHAGCMRLTRGAAKNKVGGKEEHGW